MPQIAFVEGRLVKPRGRGPCPTWFFATCHEASQGGAATYAWAGRKLMGALAGEMPYEYAEDEWHDKLEQLEELLGAEDDEQVIEWFERELPRCMKLVPKRRREQFLKGMYEEYREDGLKR